METRESMKETALGEKVEVLIAIGAATAANCIPCFEHLYEKAITSGITKAEMLRATQIAGQVKQGAHMAISNSIEELTGSRGDSGLDCIKTAAGPCRC